MKNPKEFENFVRGLRKDSPPFKLTQIEKLSNEMYNLFIDLDPKLKAQAIWSLEMTKLAGPAPEEEDDHDFKVVIAYFPPAGTISLSVYVETGVPASAYGWLLSCLNAFHLPGQSYTARMGITPPQGTGEEHLKLLSSWEVGLYDEDLFTAKGLRMLKVLVSGMLYRLCVECPSISIQLTKLYREKFPSGKLDS
jgi:hypothetical protein